MKCNDCQKEVVFMMRGYCPSCFTKHPEVMDGDKMVIKEAMTRVAEAVIEDPELLARPPLNYKEILLDLLRGFSLESYDGPGAFTWNFREGMTIGQTLGEDLESQLIKIKREAEKSL